MTKNTKIPTSDEAWESGQLGRDEEFAKRLEKDDPVGEAALDESLGLQLISIRLPKSLIEDFKLIAKLNGISYQPLMRQVMMRFAEGEKRQIMRNVAYEVAERRKKKEKVAAEVPPPKKQKAA